MHPRGEGPRAHPSWEKPLIEAERGEFERTSEELGIPIERLVEAFHRASLEELSDADWNQLQNADSRDPSWTLDDVIAYRTTDDRPERRDVLRIVEGMKRGDALPAPIVLYRDGRPPYLVAGNTRLLVARTSGRRPSVLAVRI